MTGLIPNFMAGQSHIRPNRPARAIEIPVPPSKYSPCTRHHCTIDRRRSTMREERLSDYIRARRRRLFPHKVILNGIISRAKGSDHAMQKRASMTWVGTITKCPAEKPLATVGKPYKLPDWSAVCRDFLMPNRTLCGFRHRADSAWGGRRLFDSNRPIRHECAPSTREVPHFGQLAKPPERHLLGRRSLAGRPIAFRTTWSLVLTTFSRGKDNHHRDPFPRAGGEIYFWRSEFWTEEKRRGTLPLEDAINANGSQPPDSKILICGLGIMDHNIFRDRQDALLFVKFDPVGGIGREFDFTRFCSKSGHYISNRTTSLKLCNQ